MSPLQSILHPAAADNSMIVLGLVFLGVMVFAAFKIVKLLKRHTRKAKRYATLYAGAAAVSGGGFVNIGGIPEQIGMFIGL